MILVTGANGMVGSYFPVLATEFDEPFELTDLDTLDITDRGAVQRRIALGGFSSVIHLAAETDVDRCEREPEHALGLREHVAELVLEDDARELFAPRRERHLAVLVVEETRVGEAR